MRDGLLVALLLAAACGRSETWDLKQPTLASDGACPSCSWRRIDVPTSDDLYDVAGWNPDGIVLATVRLNKATRPMQWLSSSVLRYEGGTWTTLLESNAPFRGPFWKLIATEAKNIHVVGEQRDATGTASTGGFIARYDGAWSTSYTSSTDRPFEIKVLATGEPVAAGCVTDGSDRCAEGLVLIKEGAAWTRRTTPDAADFFGIWGRSPTDIFAAGWEGAFASCGSASIQTIPNSASARFFFVLGAGTDIYVGGSAGLFRYGTSLTQVAGDVFYDLWAASSTEAYAVGCASPAGQCMAALVQRFDGQRWVAFPAPPGNAVGNIWGRSGRDLWATTNLGLYRYSP
jgi:hypothetical protein